MSWTHLLGAALAAAILWIAFFSGAGGLGLIGPDEPRYAAVAHAMAESGDWVTPRLNGEPWFEKPILYYWGAALSFRLFGESDATARLPSAITAAVSTLALAWLCVGVYGWRAGYALIVILPTTLATLAFARAASTDMVFAGTLTLAFVAAAKLSAASLARMTRTGRVLEGPPGAGPASAGRASAGPAPASPALPSPSTRPADGPPFNVTAALVAWGAFLGLALLAKGPAALLLAGGSIALWILITRRWHDALTYAHPIAMVALVAIAGPWYVLCAMRNPDFFRVFIIEHNFSRYLTPVFSHEQPSWYFGIVLIAGLVPWTPLLIPAIRDAWANIVSRDRDPVAVLAACWAIVPLVFFSLSQSKLPGYILPVFPPVALLIARTMSSVDAAPRRAARMLFSTGLLLALLALVATTAMSRFASGSSWDILLAAGIPRAWSAVVAAAGIVIAVIGWKGRPWTALTLTGVTIALLCLGVTLRIVPLVDAQMTPRAAGAAAAQVANGRPIYLHELDRSWNYGLSYYARRELPVWKGETDGVVVTNKAGMRSLISRNYHVTIVDHVSDEAILVTVTRPV